MTSRHFVRALQRGALAVGVLFAAGCVTVYPPIQVKDSSAWTEQRAIDVINQARRMAPAAPMYAGSANFTRALACNCNENGLTSVARGDLLSNKVYIYHVPFEKVASVRMTRTDIYGVAIIVCGLVNPLAVSAYNVKVNAGDAEMTFCENHKMWGTFPFWLCRPFYFLSSDRRKAAEQLTEAFEYLRLKGAAASKTDRLEDVNWAKCRATRVQMSPEEALAIVRTSLQREAQRRTAESGGKGSVALERVDRTGFAVKHSQEAAPAIVNFADIAGLGLVKAGSGQEAGFALMAKGLRVAELPFADAAERDKLFSALEALCGPFDDRDPKWGPVSGAFSVMYDAGPGGVMMPMRGPGPAPHAFRPPMR